MVTFLEYIISLATLVLAIVTLIELILLIYWHARAREPTDV